jgi:septum formation protein
MTDFPLFQTCQPLILASASPRRKEFLLSLGLDFNIITISVDETPASGELPEKFALRMAQNKALPVSQNNPHSWTIGADTIVTLDGLTIIGKPTDQENGLAILSQLSGNTHQVMTGLCLCCLDNEVNVTIVEKTEVTFADFSDEILRAYIATGEPMDKAGAYGIQGTGSFLVKKINGSASNVIGLPINRLVSLLIQHQVILPGNTISDK